MVGNLKIFTGPEEINAYSRFLREVGSPGLAYGELLWIVRAVLLHARPFISPPRSSSAG